MHGPPQKKRCVATGAERRNECLSRFVALCGSKKLRLFLDRDDVMQLFEPVVQAGEFMHAYQPLAPVDTFLLDHGIQYMAKPVTMSSLRAGKIVPLLQIDYFAIAFSNGVLNLHTGAFVPHTDVPSNQLPARVFLDYQFGSTETPLFDNLLGSVDTDYSKIGGLLRGQHDKPLFIVGDYYDDYIALAKILLACFPAHETLTLVYDSPAERSYRYLTRGKRRYAVLTNFANKHIGDSTLRRITMGYGAGLPANTNLEHRADVIVCTLHDQSLFEDDFYAELPALIAKSITCTHE